MVGPISSIGAESIRPSGGEALSRSAPTTSALSGAAGAIGGTGVLGNSQAMADVFSTVADMLKQIGGGLENDQVLRTLVALLILMSLLQGGMSASGSQQSSSGQGGIGAGSDPLLMASSYTRTTISIEQASVTSIFQSPTDSASAFGTGQLGGLGNSMDFVG